MIQTPNPTFKQPSMADNISAAYGMFNQHLFRECKNNVEDLEYYFSTSPNTAGNPLIHEFLYAVKTYDLPNLDEPLFRSIFNKLGMNQAESDMILSDIVKWKKFDKAQIQPTVNLLANAVAMSAIRRAMSAHSNNPLGFIEDLKGFNAGFGMDTEKIQMVNFSEVNIDSILAESSKGLPSSFEWVNDCFDPLGMYELPGIVLFTAVPGSGKSLWVLAEILNLALKGEYVSLCAMGDLTMKDMITRACTIYSGLPFGEARLRLPEIYKSLSEKVGDRLQILITASGEITVDEYLESIRRTDDLLMEKYGKKLSAVAIDYDSNFKSASVDDNMYSGYGKIYEAITKLSTVQGKLVFILSQPKINVWSSESLELSDVGESSRKQHTADIVITRGRWTGNQNGLGVFQIVKNRRGDLTRVYSIRIGGQFITIPKGVYDRLKEETEKRNYSIGEINSMIQIYNIEAEKLKNMKNQASPGYGQPGTTPKIPSSPF